MFALLMSVQDKEGLRHRPREIKKRFGLIGVIAPEKRFGKRDNRTSAHSAGAQV